MRLAEIIVAVVFGAFNVAAFILVIISLIFELVQDSRAQRAREKREAEKAA